MNELELCALESVAVGASKGLTVQTREGLRDVFVVRTADGVFAYMNSCPHTGGPLDWVPDKFLNLDGDLIQCATHDALFRIEDGYCVAGPCSGQRLEALTLVVRDGRVYMQQDDAGS